jgi:glycosyltransferase involved in cell wall biosynthesis
MTTSQEGGSRLKGALRRFEPSQPVVSVVTVVVNGFRNMEETVKSIIGQSYPNIEYIVVDGGSTDGTLEVIRKYEEDIDCWVSEKDNGIYDAMNKGVTLATGQWISFINAGDTFHCSDTVREVFENAPSGADLLYGNTYYKDQTGLNLAETHGIENIWKWMIFSHQSLFVKSALLRTHPLSTRFRISSDYEFVYYCYVNNYRFFDTKKIIAVHPVDGISERNVIRRLIERWVIVNSYTPSLKINIFYVILLFKKIISSIIKKK